MAKYSGVKKDKIDAIPYYSKGALSKKKEEEEKAAGSPPASSSSVGSSQSTGAKRYTGVKQEKMSAVPHYTGVTNNAAKYTSTEQIEARKAELKDRINSARKATVAFSGKPGEYSTLSTVSNHTGEYKTANEAYDAIKRYQAELDALNYGEKIYEDTFWGQFGANRAAGRLSIETHKAFNKLASNPTEENRQYAYTLDELQDKFSENNAAALDDEGAVLPWISKTAAGYLPQFFDQTKATLAGGAAGAATGAAASTLVSLPFVGAVPGFIAGGSVAAGIEMYNTMRGAAFKTLLEAGFTEEEARDAANDEALISGAIEALGTGVSLATLGTGKLLNILGNAAVKSGSKNAAVRLVAKSFGKTAADKAAKVAATEAGKTVGRKVLDAGFGIVKNAASEAVEEGLQQSVSIANLDRENTGKWDLLQESAGTLRDAVTGKDEEARNEIFSAAGEGAKIALMFGGATAVTNNVVSHYVNAKTTKAKNEYADDIIKDKESMTALIEEGKASGEGSVSAKIAADIEQDIAAGKTVTREKVKSLIESNEVYIRAEEEAAAKEARRSANEKEMDRLGYGEHGRKTLESIMEHENLTAQEANREFHLPYLKGLSNAELSDMKFTSSMQQEAFNAGKLDRIFAASKDVENAKYAKVTADSGFDFNSPHIPKTVKTETLKTFDDFSKALGNRTTFLEKIAVGEDESGANAITLGDGTIGLSADTDIAKSPEYFFHEALHRMKQLAPAESRNFINAIVSAGYTGGSPALSSVEAMQSFAADRGVTLTVEKAMEEIAADRAGEMFGRNPERATAILRDVMAEIEAKAKEEGKTETEAKAQAKNVVQRFIDAIRSVIASLKEYLGKHKNTMSRETKASFEQAINDLTAEEKLWKDALKAAVKNARDLQAKPQDQRIEFSDVNVDYSLREKAPPKKTGIAYKVFLAKNGQLYPPMVANPGGEGTPVGVWLDADAAPMAGTSKTGRPQVAAGGKGTNVGKMQLAYRPGWHLGDVPQATQFAKLNPETGKKELFPANFVWCECEYAMDHDYQEEAMSYGYTENGKFRHSYAGLPRIPEDGYYRYRTNPNPDTVPWVITGAMRVTRILTDAETDAILRENGIEPMKRQGGPIDIEKFGLKAGDVTTEAQFSLKDSAGRTLSEGQQEYFKDSKVRDKDGNLLVVYHGTERGGFTTFEDTDDIGYFFTSDRYTARTYSGSYDEFNPAAFKDWDEAKAFVEDYIPGLKLTKDGGKYIFEDIYGSKPKTFGKDDLPKFIKFFERDYMDPEDMNVGSTNYEVYLDIKDPLIIDGNGSNWDEVYDWYNGMVTWDELTEEQQEEFIDYYGEGVEFWGDGLTDADGYPMGIYDPVEVNVASSQNTRDWVREAVGSGAGYDGVIFRNITDEGKYGRGYSGPADVYVIFNPEQAKSTSNLNPTDDPDIRFSMKKPVEETKNLIALHNLNAAKLKKVLALGGFPMPSIAVTRTDIPHTNFGDITLVMNKSAIDPKASRKNTVYSADAWTPTVPRTSYKPSVKHLRDIKKKVYDLVGGYEVVHALDHISFDSDNISNDLGRHDGDLVTGYRDNNTLRYAFLKDIGEDIELPMKEEELDLFHRVSNSAVLHFAGKLVNGLQTVNMYQNMGASALMEDVELKEAVAETRNWENLQQFEPGTKAHQALVDHPRFNVENVSFSDIDSLLSASRGYFNGGVKQTVNRREASNLLKQHIAYNDLQSQYEEWLAELFDGVVEKTGIYNNKDIFTPSGNRRSFEQLHMPVTLENIVKAMRTENGGNTKNVAGFNGVKTLRAGMAKRFKSIADMHKLEGRLQNLTEEEFEAIHDQLSDRMYEIIDRVIKTGIPSSENVFMRMDSVGETLMEIAESGKITIDSIVKKFGEYSYRVGNQLATDIRDLLFDVSQMPTNMFEAKPERAVGFDEVLAAVVPADTEKKLIDDLKNAGVGEVLTYEKGNDADRLAKVNSVDNATFSLKGQSDLAKENAKLKETVAALRDQFKVTKVEKLDKKALDKFTKELLKDYTSGADLAETRDALNEMFAYSTSDNPEWDELYRIATGIATKIMEQSVEVDDEMYRQYKELREYLRTNPIYIDPAIKGSFGDYENMQDFRKKNFGRILMTSTGNSIGKAYQELAGEFPGLFDPEEYTRSTDQLAHIAEVLDDLKHFEVNPYSYDMKESAAWLANDIIVRVYDLPRSKPTFADKAKQKVKAQAEKDAAKLERVKEKHNEKIKKLIAENREKVKQTAKKEKEKRESEVKKVKEHYKQKEANSSLQRKEAIVRAKIIRHVNDLSKKLLDPTDKKHIPQELHGVVSKLLESINLESNRTYDPETGGYRKNDAGLPTARTRAFAELRKIYSTMAGELVIDHDLLGEDGLLSDVIALADKRIADMTLEELNTVYRTLQAVETSVVTANRAFTKSRWEFISEAANDLLDENGGKKEKIELDGPRGVLGKLQKLMGLDMMVPEAFFHRLGKSGDDLFRIMMHAESDHIRKMKQVDDFTHKALKGVDVRALEEKMHTVTLGGQSVQLSTAQIMELYVLMRRHQAQEHIMIGGILPDVVSRGKLKKISRAKPIRGIRLSEIGKAINQLTDEQKKLAEKLQDYASTQLGAWGNQASMKVYNYEKFGEENYWPIRVNRQETKSDIQKDTQVTSVGGRGFAKGTKPHANNSVMLGSIFDTFSTHASEMATYAAWLAPMEDINRIRNYRFLGLTDHTEDTVKGIINTVHGRQGTAYLDKLLADISNGVKGTHGETAYMGGLVGNYKAASVGANIRVIIQQPTSILRALDMIDPKYLVAGLKPNDGWKKAKKYSAIAQWKDWGYFDINTGRQMKDVLFDSESPLEKVKQASMWGAGKADSLSWGLLWNAVEAETRDKRPDLMGDSFNDAVTERFDEIVVRTQVVDGILRRSHIMRSADSITKMATAFMGEATKQYNMLLTSAYDAKNGNKGAKKRLVRTAAVLAAAGITNAAAAAIIDGLRDDDKEKDYWDKWLAAFGKNAASVANPAGYIPFVKDIFSVLQGYDVSRMDMESIEKIVEAGRNMTKALSGEGKYTLGSASANLFAEISRATGVPVANVKRDIKSIVMTAAIESGNVLLQYRMEKASLDMNYSANSKTFMDILFNAYQNDKEAYEIIYADMVKSGYEPDKIQSGMETRLKKDQGVTSSSDLKSRYLSPSDQKTWDGKMNTIQKHDVWKSATAEQRSGLEDRLYTLITSDSEATEELRAKIDAGANVGISDTDYLLFKLALEMCDEPNESGKLGSYTNGEIEEAIRSLGLTPEESHWLWEAQGKKATNEPNWKYEGSGSGFGSGSFGSGGFSPGSFGGNSFGSKKK